MLVKSISRTLYKPQAYFSRGSSKHMLIDQLKTVGDVVDITRTVFTSIPIQRSRLNKEIDIRRRNRKQKFKAILTTKGFEHVTFCAPNS